MSNYEIKVNSFRNPENKIELNLEKLTKENKKKKS